MFFGKRYHVLLALLLTVCLIISACSGTNAETEGTNSSKDAGQATTTNEPATEEKKLEPVELSYYFAGTPQKDLPLIEEEMNKILQEKINATIKLNQIDWGSYEQKMNVMIGAGDTFDLMFTAPWINNYYQNVAKGALAPLDDLLDKYAPTLKSTVPSYVWDATRINGKIYGAINWQIIAMPYGFGVNTKLAEKYGLDMDKITKYDELEPFFDSLLAGEKGITPLLFYNTYDSFNGQAPYFGMDTIGEDSSPGWIYLNDQNIKVVNQYASPEYKQYVQLMRRWYEKGIIHKDAATISDATADLKAGKYAAEIAVPVKPGVENENFLRYGLRSTYKALSPAIITTGRAIATMTGISSTSKNPERAMMFLELINSDKTLYNLLAHGIEGKHYVFADKEQGVIGMPDGVNPSTNGYAPGTDWMFGNQFNGYYIAKEDVGNWEKTLKLNADAVRSPLLGFNFNPETVKTELTQSASVIKQYQMALISGSVDPDKILPEFLEKLSQAGVDKIIAEKQKQIDAWKNQ